jgi:23S rRNA pseudouridine2605 synthase
MKTKGSSKDLFKVNEGIRLNKYIADSGICSRRKADEYITAGKVKINRKVVSELGTKVFPGDFVTLNGDPVKENIKLVYFIMNKPKNTITTTDDEKDRKTVVDIIKKQERIYPVGRLDRNTTGVLLLTNDGDLTHRLTHPKYRVPRIYNVVLDKNLRHDHAKAISLGVKLEEYETSPCEVFINPDQENKVTLTLTEGKNHEIKNLFAHFGYEVKQLDRKSYAGITTKGLQKGEYRTLNKNEIRNIKKLVGLN